MADLKPKQEQAAYLIATGSSCKEAAEVVGVTPETISQWNKNAAFIVKCNEYRQDVLDSMRDGIRSLSKTALSSLQALIENAESESVKLKACLEVLKMQGMSDPERWGWGVGYTTPEEVEQARKQKEVFASLNFM